MSVLNGQLVRLPDSSSVAIENITSGSIVTGVVLPGLGLQESDWKGWSSTDISSTELSTAEVRSKHTSPSASHDVLEINNGALTVHPDKKILVKDGDGVYRFIYAKQLELNSDSLVKYTDTGITEELVTSAYTITNQYVSEIAIEDIDVYLLNGYIVHNPEGYVVYSCEGGLIGNFYFVGTDPGENSVLVGW